MTNIEFSEQLRDICKRLNLNDIGGAQYLGTPVATFRKWYSGEREPSAAVIRLVEVLGIMEAMVPAIHAALLPASTGAGYKERTTRKRKEVL